MSNKSTKKQSETGFDLVNIAGVILPLIFVTGFSVLTLTQTEDSFRIPYIALLCSVIFGFSLSNLIRNFDLARKFDRFVEFERDKANDMDEKLGLIISNSRMLGTLSNDQDVQAMERFATWLSANRALSGDISEIQEFCDWQKTQMLNLLSTKARECRDKELLIDDPVKELNSNTTLLVRIPSEQVVAVSFEDTPFWLSEEGQRFLGAHKQVIDRGVSVTRIFIVQGADEENLSKVMSQQVDLGITVYVAELDAVQQLNPQDVVIYDTKLVRHGFNNAVTQNNMYKQARIVATPATVTEELEKTRALIAVAKKWDKPTNA